VRRAISPAVVVGLAAALALLGAGCGGKKSSGGGNAQAVSSSSCKSVYYQGGGKPDYIVVSDLPLQGSGRAQTVQMGAAIRFVLKQSNFKAGKYNIGYQECDDSTAQAGTYAPSKCTANGQAYASNKSVIAEVGTFNSPCAQLEIPILNRASGGPIPMVSPANTRIGLTKKFGKLTDPGEPDKYYPTGKKNYLRVVATDEYQGASNGLLAQQLGLKKVFILNDKVAYGLGVAKNVQAVLKALGITVAGFAAWDPKASSYEALAGSIKSTGADGVFLGGLVCNQGGKLIKDLRGQLGTDVTLFAPDGFTPVSAVAAGGGSAAEGVIVSVAGTFNSKLGPKGKKFVSDFGATQSGGHVDPYAVYAAQAAQIVLDAIAKSDGSREQVIANLFKTKVTDGILGSFQITSTGDVSKPTYAFYKIQNGQQTDFKIIQAPKDIVQKELTG
jgi:branched-chain amino acid transport system substrate-binding protein